MIKCLNDLIIIKLKFLDLQLINSHLRYFPRRYTYSFTVYGSSFFWQFYIFVLRADRRKSACTSNAKFRVARYDSPFPASLVIRRDRDEKKGLGERWGLWKIRTMKSGIR